MIMKAHRTALAIVAVLLTSACGASDDEPTLNHYGDEMTESVDAIGAALSSHHEQVLAETDLQRLRDMEGKHMDDMDMPLGDMQDAQDSMEGCGEHMTMAGHADSVAQLHEARSAMATVMGEASAETARHMQAMHDAADLDAALAEEHGHQSAMGPILERMRMHDGSLAHAMQAMEEAGISMMCPMSSHMHRQH
jgi:hypothetical protein